MLVHPLRVAVTGSTIGPSLYHLLEIVGREKILRRLEKVLEL
jgi:glutamyl-tRNA synthetase